MKKVEFKVENGVLKSGVKPVDVRREAGPCYFCHQPVLVSSGQLVKYLNKLPTHKRCRKSG